MFYVLTPLGMLDGTKTLEEYFASACRTVETRSKTLVLTVLTSVVESGVMLINTHIVTNVILFKHHILAPLSTSM